MDERSYRKIKVDLVHDGQVLRIWLASGKYNILDKKMMNEILDCLMRDGDLVDLKAIVFAGEGENFCTGASVEEHQKEQAPEMIEAFHDIFTKLLELSVPAIALVRGSCLGGGMELAFFCNFVIADKFARFGQPEIKLGVFPPVAVSILPLIIPRQHAEYLVLTGKSINTEIAKAWGLVGQVTGDLEATLEDCLGKILPHSAQSLRTACEVMRHDWIESLPALLDKIRHRYILMMEDYDPNEGIAAFLEKRDPVWKNR